MNENKFELMNFPSLISGAQHLLWETASVLANLPEMEHMIIGGWSPYLLSRTAFRHPGTLDVDVLFRSGRDPMFLKEFIRSMLKVGFVISAKHNFQMFRLFRVNDTELVYNVDILHPGMKEDVSMFVEHLDLDIPLNLEERRVKKQMSIALPNSEILFQEKLIVDHKLETHTVRLCSLEGSVITKLDSCQKDKRQRDSFDIFVACLTPTFDAELFKQLVANNRRIAASTEKFVKYLETDAKTFVDNVRVYAPNLNLDPVAEVLKRIAA